MKRIFCILLPLILLAIGLLGCFSSAGANIGYIATPDENWLFPVETSQKTGASISYYGTSSAVSIPLYIDYNGEKIRVVSVMIDSNYAEDKDLNNKTITSISFQTDENGETSVHTITGPTKRPCHITSLAVPSGVRIVQSFRNLPYLKTVKLAETVTTLGEDCFSGCSKLESVEMPGVQKFGNRVFRDTALKKAVIPEGVTELTEGLFWGCTGLASVSVPSTVTAMGARAFQGCSALEGVDLPDGIPELRTAAFKDCTALKEMILPESVTKLGSEVFSGCASLENLHLPSGLAYLGPLCLVGCDSLKELYLPGSLQEVSDNACPPALRRLEIGDGFGMNHLPWGSMAELEELIAPASVKSRLGNVVEPFPKLRKAVISCTSILRDCEDTLEELTLLDPENKDNSLKNHTALRKVTLPEGLAVLPADAFSGCTALAEINLPSTLTEIGSRALSGCPVARVSIPAGVSAIDYVFEYNTALASVTVPNSVQSMEGAFQGCTALRTVEMPWEETSVTSLKNAFRDCTSLESIWISPWITNLENAFSGCTSLSEALLSGDGRAVTNAQYAFQDCTSLSAVWIAEGKFTRIDYMMFAGSGLEEIDLPAGIAGISSSAFEGCGRLYAVRLAGDREMEIGKLAFADCPMLGAMDVPDNVTVSVDAFKNDWIELTVTEGSSAWYEVVRYEDDGIRPRFRDQLVLEEGTSLSMLAEGNSIVLRAPGILPEGDYYYYYLLETADGSWSAWENGKNRLSATFSDVDPEGQTYVGSVFVGYGHSSIDLTNRCVRPGYNGVADSCTMAEAPDNPGVAGDLSGDGAVNTTDLILLLRFVNGQDVEIKGNTDVSGDGETNTTDLILLLRYVNGQPVELH